MKIIRVNEGKMFSPMVAKQIRSVAKRKKDLIRIGVPGGRGAAVVLSGLLELEEAILQRVVLYLVDERLEGESNEQTLLASGLQEAIDNNRFTKEQLVITSLQTPFFDFEGSFDLIYLGVGEDGHIASLFPGSYPQYDNNKTPFLIEIDNSPKPPLNRVTISYRGFREYAKKSEIYLMFFGEGKKEAYSRFMAQREEPNTLSALFFAQSFFNTTVVTDIKEE